MHVTALCVGWPGMRQPASGCRLWLAVTVEGTWGSCGCASKGGQYREKQLDKKGRGEHEAREKTDGME